MRKGIRIPVLFTVLVLALLSSHAQKTILMPSLDGGTGSTNFHQWVDLGLPSGTKWATCNIGAENPYKYGDYFAWAETKPKSEYSVSNCSTCNGAYGVMSGMAYWDAATTQWGTGWYTPSRADVEELIDNCTRAKAKRNDVNGIIFKSKINGNQIFIPLAGRKEGSTLKDCGTYGYYWCSDTPLNNLTDSYRIYLDRSTARCSWSGRQYGQPVRPVTK